MAVPTVIAAAKYLDVVAAVEISVPFPLKDTSEVEIVYGHDGLVASLNDDYEVVLAVDYLSFTVTPTAALLAKINALIALDPTNELNYLTIRRTQTSITAIDADSARRGTFLQNEIERLHMHVQELWEAVFRSLKFRKKNVGTSPEQVEVDNFVTPGALLAINDTADGVKEGPTYATIIAAAVQTALDAAATAADRIATALDRIATAADRVQTGLDRVATGNDATATAADRVQTGLDKVATAADRVQTGIDKASATASANSAAANAILTALDRIATGADRVQTGADRVQTGLDVISTAAYAAALKGTSTTPNTIGTGALNFLTQTNKQFAAGQWALIVDQANIANYMHGQITSYDPGTGDFFITVTNIGGSGNKSAWNIYVSGTRGATGGGGSLDFTTISSATIDGSADELVFNDATDSTNKKATGNAIFNTIIAALSAETAVDTADTIPITDVSASTLDKATVNNVFKALNTFTALTAVDTADVMPIYDVSATAMLKATINEIFKAINTFTSETAVATGDVVGLYDVSASTMDKTTILNILDVVNLLSSASALSTSDMFLLYQSGSKKVGLTGIFGGISALTNETAPLGTHEFGSCSSGGASANRVLMRDIVTGFVDSVSYSTNADLATAIPNDDTIPLSSEGSNVGTITRNTRTGDKGFIRARGSASGTGTIHFHAVLFKDGTAVAAATCTPGSTSLMNSFEIEYPFTGDGSSHTWDLRVGPASGTMRLNGTTAARLLGGVLATTLTLTELQQ